MGKNEVTFVGRIGSTIKKGTTQNGDPYIWFLTEIEAKANSRSTENNYHQLINVMCCKKNVIDYIERVKAHQGNVVIIFGFVSSFTTEIKGKEIVANGINGNEIYIIKTKADG